MLDPATAASEKPLQINVPAFVITRLFLVLKLPELVPPSVTFPPTVNTPTPVLMNCNMAVLLAPVEFNFKEIHAAVFTSTVTVAPPIIVTASPLPGTIPPVHVVAALQLPPVAVVEIGVASTQSDVSKNNKIKVPRCKNFKREKLNTSDTLYLHTWKVKRTSFFKESVSISNKIPETGQP